MSTAAKVEGIQSVFHVGTQIPRIAQDASSVELHFGMDGPEVLILHSLGESRRSCTELW